MTLKDELKNFREFFWPLLEPLEERQPSTVSLEDVKLSCEDLDKCYDLAMKYYEDEADRKRSVESKSTIFISAIGFTTAILLSVTKDLVLGVNKELASVVYLLLILLVCIVIYMARAVWFAIKALERQGYHSLSYKDIININNSGEYRNQLIVKVINFTIKNQDVVNLKVDYMVMAHEYFKRAIIAIVLYSLCLATTYPLIKYLNCDVNADRMIKVLSSTNTGTWLLLGCLVVICLDCYIQMRRK